MGNFPMLQFDKSIKRKYVFRLIGRKKYYKCLHGGRSSIDLGKQGCWKKFKLYLLLICSYSRVIFRILHAFKGSAEDSFILSAQKLGQIFFAYVGGHDVCPSNGLGQFSCHAHFSNLHLILHKWVIFIALSSDL